MNVRWMWFDYFPSGVSLSRAERREVMRRARELQHADAAAAAAEERIQSHFRTIAWAALGGICITAWLSGWLVSMTSILVLFLLSCSVVSAFIHYRLRGPFIRRALHWHGEEVCIECGYLLRGLYGDVENCPECGAERDRELMQIARDNDLPALRARHEERPARWERTQSEPPRPRDG